MSLPPQLAPAFAAIVLALPAVAHADKPSRPPDRTIAMMSAEIGGDADPELRDQLQEAIRRGLGAAGYSLVDNDAVRRALEDDEDLLDCTSETCLQQISDTVGANSFMQARIEASGAAYTVTLELLDMEGSSVRALEKSCAVCTIVELGELVAKTAESLVSEQTEKPVPVLIISRPEGAELSIDGKTLGPAPFTGELPPGAHRVTAHLAGHAEADRPIEVKPGAEQQRFEIILTPIVTEDPGDEGPARPFRTWKWVAGGSAVAALVTGGYLLSLHGDGTCDTPMMECEERYDTLLGGLSTIGLGVALAAGSGWMFYRDLPGGKKVEAAVLPTRAGAFATIRLGF